VIVEDIACVKELDKSSPKLAEAVCKGKVFPKVEIHLTASYTNAGRQTYYAYELKNVLVTSYNISGEGQAEAVPTETFSLNFEEVKVTYTECDNTGKKKGNVEYQWKVEEGTT
jgi:type VI secretion system Hcp family effector